MAYYQGQPGQGPAPGQDQPYAYQGPYQGPPQGQVPAYSSYQPQVVIGISNTSVLVRIDSTLGNHVPMSYFPSVTMPTKSLTLRFRTS